MESITELHTLLGRWNHWLRLRRALRWGWYGLNLGLLLGLFSSLPGIYQSRMPIADFYARTALLAGLTSLLATSVGYIWPLPLWKTAAFVDRKFRLMDRISTALELLTADPLHKNPLTVLQRADTLAFFRPLKPRNSLRPDTSWRQPVLTALLVVVLMGGSILAKDYFQRSAERAAVSQVIEAETARLRDLLTRIEQEVSTPEETREQLASAIETAWLELQEAENIEQAVAAMEQSAGELRSLADRLSPGNRMENLGDRVKNGDLPTMKPFIDSLAAGDLEAAAAYLESVSTQAPETFLPDLAADLEQIAVQAGQFDPELAAILDAAAQAVRAGDPDSANANLTDAAETIRQAASTDAAAALSSDLLAEITGSQERLRSAASPAGYLGDAGGAPGVNLASGANLNAQGPSSGQGTGAGQETGDPANSEIGESGPAPLNQQIQPGDGGLADYEQIYAPIRLDGDAGPTISLPGTNISGGQVEGQSPGSVPEPELSQVPYVDVFAQYKTIYRQAIDTGQVPPHLRELVRIYFSSLEPD